MQKVRSFISMLMLVLLLFPMVEKAMHEIEHSEDKHCGIKDTHFCESEHNCSICDYTFSSPSTAPNQQVQINTKRISIDRCIFGYISNETTSPKYSFSLRGPPTC
jgi:hypothetical protein